MSPYLLLGIFFVALLDLLVSKDVVAKHIGKSSIASVIKSALFGIPLPLCSCGVVPTSVYLSKSGASKSSVISFLISTPQTGIDSIVATYGMLGPVFAIFRPIAAFLMGIIGGIITIMTSKERPKKENLNILNIEVKKYSSEKNYSDRVRNSLKYAFVDFVDDISVQFLWGLVIAGLITFLVPDDFFTNYLGGNEFLAMLVVLFFGIPMYVCATGSIPVAISLMMKGFSPGVAYVFLVSGPVSNAASIAILSKTMGKKALIIYIFTVTFLSIIFGYLLNIIFEITGVDPHTQILHNHLHNNGIAIWQFLLSVFFLILLLSSYYRKFFKRFAISEGKKMNQKIFKVDGMTCNHCVMNVTKAIKNVAGVVDVDVNLSEGLAIVKGEYSVDMIKKAIEDIGYTFKGEI